jgi:hypothetical protein
VDKSGFAQAISAFGDAAKEKLANTGAKGNPEDQLRAPLESLMPKLASAAGGSRCQLRASYVPGTDDQPDLSILASLHVGGCEGKADKLIRSGEKSREKVGRHDRILARPVLFEGEGLQALESRAETLKLYRLIRLDHLPHGTDQPVDHGWCQQAVLNFAIRRPAI